MPGARSRGNITQCIHTFNPSRPAARIGYFVGGVIQPEVAWRDGAATDARLSNISVFDSKCASIHVDGKNELAYTPAPLQLCKRLRMRAEILGLACDLEKAALEAQVPAFRKKPASRDGGRQFIKYFSMYPQQLRWRPLTRWLSCPRKRRGRLEQLKRDLASDSVREVRKLTAQKQRIEQLTDRRKADLARPSHRGGIP